MIEVRRHLYDDYPLYLYTPFSGIIDYGEGIEAWSNPNSTIELSEENVKTALRSQTIKNGFTLASFNNQGLRDQLVEILEKVDLTFATIENELQKRNPDRVEVTLPNKITLFHSLPFSNQKASDRKPAPSDNKPGASSLIGFQFHR